MEVATATHTQAVAARQEPIPAVAVEPVAIPAQESTSLASSVEVKSAPIEVTRVETALEGPALKMLKETDELLSLSDTQYNELVALMEARQVEWKALMAKQKVLTDTEFNGRKKALFGGYSKRMMALFTPEQLKLWRNR
ncbi:MAG TPA: hypothetical protein DCX06_12580 [Opitutae bacterium]|nr:hypothetical protein [Opitutae bacterium]